jgi:Xaa-Pro dipeptidase
MRSDYARMETAFPKDYYLGNLTLIQDDPQAKGLACVAIFDPESIYWLTGYRSIGYFTFQCALVLREGGPLMVSRRVNRAVALSNENIAGFVAIEDTDDAVEILARTLRERVPSDRAIGVETGSWYLTVQAWKALSQAVTSALVDWGGLIERSRTIKTPAQLGYMRQAARAAVAGVDARAR